MAELNVSAGVNRHQGIARSKKLSTRVDLTPMVDLGFLLITFFVFTTTVSSPTTMKLLLPADAPVIDNMLTPESVALTVIPIANNRVFYYHGDLKDAGRTGRYSVTNISVTGGIGAVIRQKQQALNAGGRFKGSDLVLIIRPMKDASYKSVVDALDEVLINQVSHYSFVDITEGEKNFISTHPDRVF